jgi:hypothetical protein
MKKGGITELVPDPTNSGRGIIQRSVVGSGGNPPEEEQPGQLVYRLYPAEYFHFQPAPCQARVDVWANRDLIDSAILLGNITVIGPDVFDDAPEAGGNYHTAMQAALTQDSVVHGKVYPRLFHAPAGALGTIEPNAPEFTPEQWHTIRILVDQNRDAKLYQDGILVSTSKLTPDSRAGSAGGHTGLYVWQRKSNPIYKGMLLTDNCEITCW